MILALLTSLALAQDAPQDAPVEADAAEDAAVAMDTSVDAPSKPKKEKKTKKNRPAMEVGIRGRYVSVPQGIMDAFFFSADDEGWPLPDEDRPKLHGWAIGFEYVVKNKTERGHGVFWFEYIDSLMQEGYWDDKEDPPDHLDGDYIAPTDNFGFIAFGGDYNAEIPFVKLSQTKGAFGLGMIVGGGLGLGITLGDLDRWVTAPDGTPAYILYERGEEPNAESKFPPVVPLVDFNLGLKFNFGNRAALRLEGGLHSGFYYGGALSVLF